MAPRKRYVDVPDGLHLLNQRDPAKPFLLLLDNAGIHKSQITVRRLDHHPRLMDCYLPAYIGRETHPVEKFS